MTEKNSRIITTVEGRETLFLALYKIVFPAVARYIARKGESLEEAQDIFQDTLIIYYEKIASAQAGIILNEQAYLIGVAKNLWLQYYKAEIKNDHLNDVNLMPASDEKIAASEVMEYLEAAGKKCLELLKAYYYDCLPINDVAALFGYKSSHSATVAKYKCMEKVRESVKQKLLNYADFIE